jgi:hypothetical protein
VKHPGADRDSPANREPPRAEEAGGASQRVADLHRGREDRATVPEQKADARRGGAGEREGESGDHADDRPLVAPKVPGGRRSPLIIWAQLLATTS